MTKEEVLQKVNDYCNEKSYTTATLTDAFKDKFADHFQKANVEGDINDEAMLNSMKFALNTAFSSASDIATVKQNAFASKENEYKMQIAELQKRVKTPEVDETKPAELPDEVKTQLAELQSFKDERTKKEKLDNIIKIAKEGIRSNLHASFDKYVEGYNVALDKEDKEQAQTLLDKFRAIFKDSIGDIKPMTPVQTAKQEEEFIASIPKISVS